MVTGTLRAIAISVVAVCLSGEASASDGACRPQSQSRSGGPYRIDRLSSPRKSQAILNIPGQVLSSRGRLLTTRMPQPSGIFCEQPRA